MLAEETTWSPQEAILKYSRFIRKRRKKDAGLRKKMNYSEQMAYLIPGSDADRERMTDILERAGFSKEDISASDYEFAEGILKSLSPKLEK